MALHCYAIVGFYQTKAKPKKAKFIASLLSACGTEIIEFFIPIWT